MLVLAAHVPDEEEMLTDSTLPYPEYGLIPSVASMALTIT